MAEATQTATEYNFKLPNGSYGGEWSASLVTVEGDAKQTAQSLGRLGAVDQTVEVVSRARTITFSEESHYKAFSA